VSPNRRLLEQVHRDVLARHRLRHRQGRLERKTLEKEQGGKRRGRPNVPRGRRRRLSHLRRIIRLFPLFGSTPRVVPALTATSSFRPHSPFLHPSQHHLLSLFPITPLPSPLPRPKPNLSPNPTAQSILPIPPLTRQPSRPPLAAVTAALAVYQLPFRTQTISQRKKPVAAARRFSKDPSRPRSGRRRRERNNWRC
jgi:hypothetical protein